MKNIFTKIQEYNWVSKNEEEIDKKFLKLKTTGIFLSPLLKHVQ